MNNTELKSFLDQKVVQYNTLDFIETDPVQIPHLFSLKEDIEIAGFLSATIAWGNRKMIIKNAHKMMDLMGNSPYDFVMSHSENDLERMESFVHRTFNGIDFEFFIQINAKLQNITEPIKKGIPNKDIKILNSPLIICVPYIPPIDPPDQISINGTKKKASGERVETPIINWLKSFFIHDPFGVLLISKLILGVIVIDSDILKI